MYKPKAHSHYELGIIGDEKKKRIQIKFGTVS